MILQSLKEYYDRKAIDGSISQEGWIKGGLDFYIELDNDGNPLDIHDLREYVGNKKVARQLNVPNIGKQALKHSNSGKDANLLWDNAAFVLGQGDKGDLRLQSMIDAIDQWIGKTDDEEINAVRNFLVKGLDDR